ncbi:hypothetical protein CGCF413_v004537 [Colletotrichum fructicola]|nr:hypothetical protein CGCF413_v004537 [Colletotrichum fructicola]
MTNHTATIPRLAPPPPPLLHLQPPAQHNASVRHPVFFTEKLRRPPLVLSPGMGMSPVAHGSDTFGAMSIEPGSKRRHLEAWGWTRSA